MYQEGSRRLKALMKRAERGGKIVIGFFGGSITQGSLASEPEYCYAERVFRWWRETFPQAEFHFINAGIGGTSSLFGAARVWEDLLMYRPDFVVVDFSVNDDVDDSFRERLFRESYEGVIRRIFYSETNPAMLLLNNIYYDTGKTAEDVHAAVGDYYGIPHVSIRDSIYRRMQSGEFEMKALTSDGLHPNDFGHGLVAEQITDYLQNIYTKITEPDGMPARQLPALTKNRFSNARRLTIQNANPICAGFRPDPREKNGHLDFFKNGWTASLPGERIRFTITGAEFAAVQYRKSVKRPAPKAICIPDGDICKAVVLDGAFEEDWGDCLYLEPIRLSAGVVHTLDIKITDATEEDASDFYLISVIIA